MRARLTERHTLYLAHLAVAAANAKSRDAPRGRTGAWGCWLLDEGGRLVVGSRSHMGGGEAREASRRAYDCCVALLTRRGQAQDLVSYDYLAWE